MLCKLNLNLFKLWESGNILFGLRVAAFNPKATQLQLNSTQSRCHFKRTKASQFEWIHGKLLYYHQHSLNRNSQGNSQLLWLPSSALIDWQKISRQIFSQSVSKQALLADIFPRFVFICIVIGLWDCLVLLWFARRITAISIKNSYESIRTHFNQNGGRFARIEFKERLFKIIKLSM